MKIASSGRILPSAQRSTRRSLLDREDAGLILLLFATVALFAAFKIGYLRAARHHPEQLVPIFACVCVMSLAFAGLRYGQLHPGFSLLLRGISLSLGVYVAASWTGMSGGSPALILTMDVVRYASLAAVVASMVRPSFAMIPCVYVLVNKDVTQHALQLPWLTRTDYLPVVELGIFMTFGVIVVHLLSWLAKRGTLFHSSRFVGVADARSSSVALLLVAVAIHFGNYFWSAMAKVLLDGGPLDWMLENKTHLLTATAYATGNLPLGHSRELSDSVFAMLSQVYVPLNIATLVAQIVSVVAIMRIRSAIAITAFYDVTHVVIFVVTGIFFWKWILLNTVLVFALSRVREADVRPILRVIGPLFVAGATVVFFAARLGWYETPALNDHYFVAETETGTRYSVPTNYFLAASVTVAQQRLGSPTTAVFPTLVWATTLSQEVRRTAERECASQPLDGPRAYRGREEQIRRFAQQHHAHILALSDDKGRVPYDWYPHHIWSNPWMFQDFNRLDKRTILRYWYVVEPKCVGTPEHPLRPLVRARYELEIPVR